MAERTGIEWCDATFNPWVGCTRVSPACDDCYAARSTPARTLGVAWGGGQRRHRTAEATWKQPEAWERAHAEFYAEHGRRRRVFCASLADVFDNEVPVDWRVGLFRLIAATPHLDWLLLTKRIGNVGRMLVEAERLARAAGHWSCGMLHAWTAGRPSPANVWLGVTVVNQAEADRDIPKLLAVPARVRFLSIEPMLGPIDLSSIRLPLRGESYVESNVLAHKATLDRGAPRAGIDWVICGGESGPKARPMHPDWARSLRDQCAAAGVPFLFKQHGEWAPGSGDFGAGAFQTAAIERTGQIVVPGGFTVTNYPKGAESRDGWAMVHRPGKKAAGRLLDGVEHNGFPEVAHA